MRDRWSVRTPFGTVDLELDARRPDASERAESVRQATLLVHCFAGRDPATQRVLREVCDRLRGAPPTALRLPLPGSPGAAEMAAEIVGAARIGRLAVLARPSRRVAIPLGDEPDSEVLGPEPEPTDWIEIELLDERGEAVRDVAYRIECPDGRVRTGCTNLYGRAREDGLKASVCVVTFPRLHAREWAVAAAAK